MDSIGRTRWAIAEGYIPGQSHGPAPELESHEACCILNTGDAPAQVALTVLFTDREPAGSYRVTVEPRRMVQATSLFEYRRLPECFAGHPRDDAHPFPAIYPAANVPQVWSASTVVTMMQAKLGIYAHAPSGVLCVDPHLPDWLPEITVRNLRVGTASADLRFFRDPKGKSGYEVLDVRGELKVLGEASPWALNAKLGELHW